MLSFGLLAFFRIFSIKAAEESIEVRGVLNSWEAIETNLDFRSFTSFSFSKDLVNSSFMTSMDYPMVKSPVEWFVATCRVLRITPSESKNPALLLSHLQKLSQIPFAPPNVGGWPAGEMWLTSASAQFRLALTQTMFKNL